MGDVRKPGIRPEYEINRERTAMLYEDQNDETLVLLTAGNGSIPCAAKNGMRRPSSGQRKCLRNKPPSALIDAQTHKRAIGSAGTGGMAVHAAAVP